MIATETKNNQLDEVLERYTVWKWFASQLGLSKKISLTTRRRIVLSSFHHFPIIFIRTPDSALNVRDRAVKHATFVTNEHTVNLRQGPSFIFFGNFHSKTTIKHLFAVY